MAEAAGIFVSHAHEDNDWCRAFVHALRDAGANVWYDEHDLGYGTIGEEIERELMSRPIFLVVFSPRSVGKPWVCREMTAAMNLQDEDPARIILPVFAEKTKVPLFWRSYKRIEGQEDSGLNAQEAARRVVHALAIVPAQAPAAVVPPDTSESLDDLFNRGRGLMAQKRYKEALTAFDRATGLNGTSIGSWLNKALILNLLNRPDEALVAVDRALALDPSNAHTWSLRSTSLYASSVVMRLSRPYRCATLLLRKAKLTLVGQVWHRICCTCCGVRR